MLDLEQQLSEFDGVAVSILSEARTMHRDKPGFLEDVIRLCVDARPAVSDGAAWIVKAEADEGQRFGPTMLAPLVDKLDEIPSWQAKLMICQSIEAFDLTAAQARTVYKWANALADHRRPFLRAWSLHARAIIAQNFDAFRKLANQALSVAANDPAASVRARARNLQKMLAKRSQS